jgi:Tfp pilus assembly protein PilO
MTANTRKNRERLLATITVAVIIGAVIFACVIWPQLRERQLRLQRMRGLQLKLTRMQRDLLEKDRIDQVYSQIEPLISGTGTDLQEKSKFARELYDLFLTRNVQTRAVNPLPLLNEEFYRRLAIKIDMTGNIRDILKFIFAVETSANPIKIEKLELKARETVDDIRASFTVTKVVARTEGEYQVDGEQTVE